MFITMFLCASMDEGVAGFSAKELNALHIDKIDATSAAYQAQHLGRLCEGNLHYLLPVVAKHIHDTDLMIKMDDLVGWSETRGNKGDSGAASLAMIMDALAKLPVAHRADVIEILKTTDDARFGVLDMKFIGIMHSKSYLQ